MEEFFVKGYIRFLLFLYGVFILFFRKKNGKLRMCMDYRVLNSFIKCNSFLLLRIDELLENFVGVRYFIKIDLVVGYY